MENPRQERPWAKEKKIHYVKNWYKMGEMRIYIGGWGEVINQAGPS